MSTHPCPARGCGLLTPTRYFMCRQHWSQVPHHLKADIWRHYRQSMNCRTREDFVKHAQRLRERQAAATAAVDSLNTATEGANP